MSDVHPHMPVRVLFGAVQRDGGPDVRGVQDDVRGRKLHAGNVLGPRAFRHDPVLSVQGGGSVPHRHIFAFGAVPRQRLHERGVPGVLADLVPLRDVRAGVHGLRGRGVRPLHAVPGWVNAARARPVQQRRVRELHAVRAARPAEPDQLLAVRGHAVRGRGVRGGAALRAGAGPELLLRLHVAGRGAGQLHVERDVRRVPRGLLERRPVLLQLPECVGVQQLRGRGVRGHGAARHGAGVRRGVRRERACGVPRGRESERDRDARDVPEGQRRLLAVLRLRQGHVQALLLVGPGGVRALHDDAAAVLRAVLGRTVGERPDELPV